MLKINDLTKNIDGKLILRNINLQIDEGDILAIVGSNGCGKTTLLSHVMNIYRPNSGACEYNGIEYNLNTVLKDFYFIQDYVFFPKGKTVLDLFKYDQCFYENSSKEILNNLLTEFKFNLKDVPSKMSKGQKKIIAFILAIASNAKVLILDELIDGLDIVMKKRIWAYLIDQTIERNSMVLISSHDIKELNNVCNRYVLMHEGKIVKENIIETEKEELTRVQFSIDKEFTKFESEQSQVVSFSQFGSVVNAFVKGDCTNLKEELSKQYTVGIYEELEVTLEDIMLFGLKEEGYSYE